MNVIGYIEGLPVRDAWETLIVELVGNPVLELTEANVHYLEEKERFSVLTFSLISSFEIRCP